MSKARRVVAFSVTLMVIPAFILSIHTPSLADTLDTPTAKSSLRPGAWALQFEFNGEDLTSFQGATFSGKRHYSSASAIRLGVGINSAITESDTQDGQDVSNERREEALLDVTIQYAYYMSAESDFTPYLYLGPRASFSWRKQESSELPAGYEDEYKDKGWGTGLAGGFGIEWFPHSRISLLAEYRSAMTFTRHSTTRWSRLPSGSTSTSTIDTDRISVAYDIVRFGVSLYF